MIPHRRPRILVVLAHFDELRNPYGRPAFIPQGVGHAFLAGAFHPGTTEVRIYSEFHSGPLLDEKLLGWPDMVVLTGVTSAFDRMRQITAHVRTLAPSAVVVAGGPAVRNLPELSRRIFDYSCDGDIEELQTLAAEVLGPSRAAAEMVPRFDLLGWKSPVNYVESSRYCNFRCSFCSLTGEGRTYQPYAPDYVERQILSQPRDKYLLFVDNNFYGNSRAAFRARLDLLRTLWRDRRFKGWIALVTNDFFARPENLDLVRESGCVGLFSGVESLNRDQLRRYRKTQNLATPQLDAIRACLQSGIVFQYGMIFDPARQRLAEMQDELNFILDQPDIPLPAFLTLAIPLLGTPYFRECMESGLFLPDAKLRDMDGFTLMTRPLDPVEELVPFVRTMSDMKAHRRQVLRHSCRFFRTYRRALPPRLMANMIANAARLLVPRFTHNPARMLSPRPGTEQLTYVTSTQPPGPLYRPAIRLAEQLKDHFEPTMITDARGALHPMVEADLGAERPALPESAEA